MRPSLRSGLALLLICTMSCGFRITTIEKHKEVLSFHEGPAAPFNLKVNSLVTPFIDSLNLRFSWNIQHSNRSIYQESFTIEVTILGCGDPQVKVNQVVWSSGRVVSSAMNILYAEIEDAQALVSDAWYSWTLQWWDQNGQSSASSTSYFGTALLQRNDWTAQWVGGDFCCNTWNNSYQDNLYRKQFTVATDDDITWGRVYVSGLGYYELYINNKRIGDYRLDPGWTTYYKTVFYTAYDVREYLQEGENVIILLLGHGWYASNAIREPNGHLSVIFQMNIAYESGQTAQVVSDLTWYGNAGPIQYDSIYNGETYNAMNEQLEWYLPNVSYTYWRALQPMADPNGVLRVMPMPHIRVETLIEAVNINSLAESVFVYDFGQQMSGWCILQVNGTKGSMVTLRHAEVIYPNGSINVDNLRSAKATDVYILKGDSSGETYEPRFTYHGFRFVELSFTGEINKPVLSTLTAAHAHSDVAFNGQFAVYEPSNTLNAVQHNIIWSQKSNLQHTSTDCVVRDERKGWMGGAALATEAMIHNFDISAFHNNFLFLITEDQYPTGSLASTSPWTWADMGQDSNEMGALPFINYYLALYNNDTDIIEKYYASNQLYMSYLVDYLKTTELQYCFPGAWGDWVPPPPQPWTSVSYASAFGVLLAVQQMVELSQAINKQSDSQMYQALLVQLTTQFNEFYNQSTFSYASGLQTDLVLALYLDAPGNNSNNVFINLLNSIALFNGHLTSGILGTKYVFEVLHKFDMNEVALQIVENVDYPSYGFMSYNNVESPATAMWERWDSAFEDGSPSWLMDSRNQVMYTSVGSWFYKVLGGIRLEQIGDNTITIDPSIHGAISAVDAEYATERGFISTKWSRTGGPLCGIAAENYNLVLDCNTVGSKGVIDNILFASFGAPLGTCISYGINTTCNAGSTLDVVKKMCIGQSSCTIEASATIFDDPCRGVFKRLLVDATCSPPASLAYFLSASIPTNSHANIAIDRQCLSNIVVTEGGVTVWQNNTFADSVEGITGAQLVGNKIIFEAGSGNYSFSASGELGQSVCVTNATQITTFKCPSSTQTISSIKFASFGNPAGSCGAYQIGSCNYGSTKFILKNLCLGLNQCTVDLNPSNFGFGPLVPSCSGQYLNAEVMCTFD